MADTTNPYAEFLGDKEPYFVLRSTADRIQELTAGLTARATCRPPEAGQVVDPSDRRASGGLRTVFQTRARMIMFQNNPTLVSFDQDPWVLGWMRENEPWDETLLSASACCGRSILRLFLNAEAARS